MIPAIIAPALLLAAIAGTAALLGGAIIWARKRQRRLTEAARQGQEMARREHVTHE